MQAWTSGRTAAATKSSRTGWASMGASGRLMAPPGPGASRRGSSRCARPAPPRRPARRRSRCRSGARAAPPGCGRASGLPDRGRGRAADRLLARVPWASPPRGGSYGVVLDEDAELARRDVHRVADGEPELRVALPAHVDGQHDAEGLGVDAHLHHRARRVDMRDLRLEARPAVPRAHDLELVRTDEGRRGARLVVRVGGVGDLQAAEAGPPVLHAAVEDVHVAEEVHDERVGGVLEDLLGRARLLDMPVVHDDDAVGDLERLLLVVRDEHAGHVQLVVQAPEPLAELLAHACVERPEGLVEQEDLGFGRQRAGERHALALPARDLTGHGALVALELHQPEQLAHPRAHARPRHAAHAQPEGDVLEHGEVPEERVVLEDEAHVTLGRRRVGHVLVGVADGARVGDLQAGDDAEQRRLPRAGGAEERQQRAARHLEAHLVESDERPEGLRHALDRDAHASPRWVRSRAASARSRRVFHSSAVFTNSVTSASMASTDDSAKAPGRLYSWKSFSTRRGMVSVFPAMWPETTYTAPNSPIARALQRITPYRSPHLMLGSVTSRNTCQPRAPRLTAATSSSAPIASMSGINSRATTGKVTKAVARMRPGRANTTLRSCARSHGPKVPCRPKRRRRKSPTTTGETVKGRSMRAVSSVRPGKRKRAIAHAAAMPKVTFSPTAMGATMSVSLIEWSVSASPVRFRQ